MKLTAKVKLKTTDFQFRALQETLKRANACCDWISNRAWEAKSFRTFDLHELTYHEARRRFDLTAQVVIRCISKVADAYRLDYNATRSFRPEGAIAYDDRILKWYVDKGIVSIWTTSGRLKVPFAAGPRQLALLQSRQGESDLILHDGKFYLAAICNAEEPDPSDVGDFLGVDLGISNVATDSDGRRYSGSTVKSVRYRHRRLRSKLQRKQTRAAKRLLKKLSGKESRFSVWVNHNISKQIVASAKGTDRGLAVEDLTGIRDRITVGRKQRVILHSWAFAQLRAFLEYKSKLAGVPLVVVDPRNSSRECSSCGHTDKRNRPSQNRFHCRSCGFTTHADHNAAMNLRARGGGAISHPNLTGCAVVSHDTVKSRRS
jgi:putative transposase